MQIVAGVWVGQPGAHVIRNVDIGRRWTNSPEQIEQSVLSETGGTNANRDATGQDRGARQQASRSDERDWERNTLTALRESCRASVAVEKAVAEAIQSARTAGMSWDEIGRTLGVAEHADDKTALIGAFAGSRRAILEHELRRTS